MSAPDAHAAAQDAARLLKPWALLGRLRPVRAMVMHHRLREYERLSLGLRLLRQHFPEALAGYDDVAGHGWWEILAEVANRVEEAGWFKINWPVLNEAWTHWMNNPEEEQGDHLAVFLHYIPVKLYGFSDTETLFNHPPMELLHALLADCEIPVIASQVLIDAEIYDHLESWTAADRAAAWQVLEQIETDPGRYPEPVRWLPELARWACHCTGNVMLDQTFDPYRDSAWFTWRSDLLHIRTAWRRAGPVIAVFHRLMHWSDQDSANLFKLANFVMYGSNPNELDW